MGYEVYSGSCMFSINMENRPWEQMNVTLPFDPPCSIQDAEILVSITQTVLMLSDRNYGLIVYNVTVIL